MQWDTPCYDLLDNVYGVLAKEVNTMLDNHFYPFQHGGLHRRAKSALFIHCGNQLTICHRSIVNDVLSECQAAASQRIKRLLDMEIAAPFTLNEHHYKDYREKFLEHYHNERFPPTEHKEGHPYREQLIAKDPHGPALHDMASTRAYFQGLHRLSALTPSRLLTVSSVASKRFADMVPMTIDQELLRGLDWNRGLHSALTKGLEITGPGSLDKAKEYLQEPPDIKNRRESLSRKRERLLSAKRELQNIGSFHPVTSRADFLPPPRKSEAEPSTVPQDRYIPMPHHRLFRHPRHLGPHKRLWTTVARMMKI